MIIAGRLGQDPELRVTPSGAKVANFSIATNRTWKNKDSGEKVEETEWVKCIAWGSVAETIVKFFKKGKEIYVEGRQKTSDWVGEDKVKRYKTEMIVETFQFVGYDNDKAAGVERAKPEPKEPPTEEPTVEDIPF